MFVRPFLLFGFDYFVRFGFMDGVPGLIFHVLQRLWFRFLIDAKIYETRLLIRPISSEKCAYPANEHKDRVQRQGGGHL